MFEALYNTICDTVDMTPFERSELFVALSHASVDMLDDLFDIYVMGQY